MSRGGGRNYDNFFNDPFGGFGGSGFGNHRSLISNFFGGRNPFDDPFFNRPLGSSMFGSDMFGGSNMMGPSMFPSNIVTPGGTNGGYGGNVHGGETAGFVSGRPVGPASSGVVIEEILDDSGEDDVGGEEEQTIEEGNEGRVDRNQGAAARRAKRDAERADINAEVVAVNAEKNNTPRKHLQDHNDEVEGRRLRHVQPRNSYNMVSRPTNQTQTFSFQSSTVSYGGMNGAYYTSSTTRQTGGDGVILEESREADTTTGQAAHRVSRGIRDKGHSLTRKLDSSGQVDTMQTLHNLEEYELNGFEKAWEGDAKKHLLNVHVNHGSSSGQHNVQITGPKLNLQMSGNSSLNMNIPSSDSGGYNDGQGRAQRGSGAQNIRTSSGGRRRQQVQISDHTSWDYPASGQQQP